MKHFGEKKKQTPRCCINHGSKWSYGKLDDKHKNKDQEQFIRGLESKCRIPSYYISG